MVSLSKKRALLWLCIAMFAFIFAGCSSSNGSDNDVPLAAPTDMGLDARSGILTVQFTRINGIGAEGTTNYPKYEVFIGTMEDGSDMEQLGEVPSNDDSYLVRFNVVRAESDNETGAVFPYPALTDGKQYWIFVRTDFASSGYGKSKFAKISAVPIPMPKAIENVNIAIGDQRIVITWDANEYEEYGINANDCPKNNSNHLTPGFWGITGAVVSGNNYVHTLTDNTEEYFFCIAATNVNGNGEWYILGDKSVSPIVYDKYHGEAATSAPAASAVTIVKNANKRVDISFPAVVAGPASASDYQYAFRESGGSWSNWESVLITSLSDYNAATGGGIAQTSIANLTNGKTYEIKVQAINAVSTGVEGASANGAPVYTELDFANPDEYLSKANAAFIYAEDIPHSDFWRISDNYAKGGRPSTDRLVRGKETALGNLFADAVQWYAKEKGYNTDFAWLMGDMINTGIQNKQTITPKFLQSIISQDYLDDTLVIATVKGSKLISQLDYDINLNNYPVVDGKSTSGYATTLFGQAAAVYRNGHYGGSGGTTYNGKYWGIPSKEVRYTIEYLPYSLDDFNTNFNSKPDCVAARDAKNGEYDVKTDVYGCYLMPYAEANPESGDPDENAVMGYKRGKIKNDSLTINGAAILPTQDYKVITTKRLADTEYNAFLGSAVQNTGVTLVRAVAEYIYNEGSAGMTPYLDGRVKLEGGVPGDSANDF